MIGEEWGRIIQPYSFKYSYLIIIHTVIWFQVTNNNSPYKLATVVEGNQKAPFSIATTLRCRRRCYSFPELLHFTLICTLYCWVFSKEVSSTIFKVFGMTWPGTEPKSPGPLANTSKQLLLQVNIFNANNLYKVIQHLVFLSNTNNLLGITTPVQSGPVSNGNEGALNFPQSSITRASISDAI